MFDFFKNFFNNSPEQKTPEQKAIELLEDYSKMDAVITAAKAKQSEIEEDLEVLCYKYPLVIGANSTKGINGYRIGSFTTVKYNFDQSKKQELVKEFADYVKVELTPKVKDLSDHDLSVLKKKFNMSSESKTEFKVKKA